MRLISGRTSAHSSCTRRIPAVASSTSPTTLKSNGRAADAVTSCAAAAYRCGPSCRSAAADTTPGSRASSPGTSARQSADGSRAPAADARHPPAAPRPGPISRIASSLIAPCIDPWRRSIALAGVAGWSHVSWYSASSPAAVAFQVRRAAAARIGSHVALPGLWIAQQRERRVGARFGIPRDDARSVVGQQLAQRGSLGPHTGDAVVSGLERDKPEALVNRRVDDELCALETAMPSLASLTAANDMTESSSRGRRAISLGLVGSREPQGHTRADEHEKPAPSMPALQLLEHAQGEDSVLVPEVGADTEDRLGTVGKLSRAARRGRRVAAPRQAHGRRRCGQRSPAQARRGPRRGHRRERARKRTSRDLRPQAPTG